jgi:tRNA-Thr(GGU) m(6)t(6)A37 methyltransferase TsaA
MEIQPIGTIHTAFTEKFGIPRQSMIVKAAKGVIHFEPPYDQAEYFKGIEEFSHLWILWHFSEQKGRPTKATVRPPRLGGNVRVGVFASRSPYRPNQIAMSSVQLDAVHTDENGKVSLEISGVDMLDGTPIFDVKPYIKTDIHEDAKSGFVDAVDWTQLDVEISDELMQQIPEYLRDQLIEVLAQDPRPRTQTDVNRMYGMRFGDFDIHFKVNTGILKVIKITSHGHD